MNWCQKHWDRLKELLKEKGLWQFVAHGGEAVVENIEHEQISGEEVFDPLIGSWSRINGVMLENRGMERCLKSCPLCILIEDGQPELVEGWLNGVTDQALYYAKEQGLIKEN